MKKEELRRLFIEEKYLFNWCFGFKSWKWNEDGSVDVVEDVLIGDDDQFKKLPVRFRKVNGNFYCSNNILETLEGCPEYVEGWFGCSKNNLKSLDFLPKEIGSGCYVYDNPGNFTVEDVSKRSKVYGGIYIKNMKE